MVRRRITVRHSRRWERSECVDDDEQLVVMSSDKLCFSSLVREVHKLLQTDPSKVEYQLFYVTSTNTDRQIRASLQDDGDLLDLLHEQTAEIVVYVISRHLSSSGVRPSIGTEYRNPCRDDYVPYFPQYYEGPSNPVDCGHFQHEEAKETLVDEEDQAETDAANREEGEEGVEGKREEEEQEQEEENARTSLMKSLLTELCGWIRSSDRTDRLLGLMGAVSSSTTGLLYRADGASSNWVVSLADLDIAGLLWDERPATQTYTLHEGAIFRMKDDLALAVEIYYMQNRVVYVVYRSNKTQLGYICKHGSDCPFRIVLKPKEMMAELIRELGIHIDYSFALRARNIAIEMVYGDCDKSYEQLPAFTHTLQLLNPGTLIDMQITSEDRFKHLFLTLGP
ncbi:hypothetical protein C2S51_007156 [Perilla frutescens var. frutescens]|nr:hypothetical protein C2S51_007156 [Perilla frutescens var. frutescens]